MKLEVNDNYYYLSDLNNNNQCELLSTIENYKKSPINLIIKLNIELINNTSLISSLVKYSSFWKKSDKSFILVVEDYVFKNKNLVSVPTLDEAIDYLFMEELERNV